MPKRLVRWLFVSGLLAAPPAFAEAGVSLDLAPGVGVPSVNYGLQLAYHGEKLGVLLRAEHSIWFNLNTEEAAKRGTLDIALGGEWFHFERRGRTSLYVGISRLLFDTPLDLAGATGPFLDWRPLGVRLPLGGPFHLLLDPLHVVFIAPVLGALPLIVVQYRATVGIEIAR